MNNLETPWQQLTLISIDLETTGKYPLDAEICEMAAVKWQNGSIVGEFQSLIKPALRMSAEVIAIHNISNEMVEDAPLISEKLNEFRDFIKDGIVIAHHAPFDVGFLAWEFEKAGLSLPQLPVLCTSLISQNFNSDVKNHRLATLAAHFEIAMGSAHRALDDAKTCLAVGLKYFEKMGPEAKLKDIMRIQNVPLTWERFSVEILMEREQFRSMIRALRDKREIQLRYESGSRPGEWRKVFPMGLVRNPQGDYLVATQGNSEGDEIHPKRFYLNKISAAKPIG